MPPHVYIEQVILCLQRPAARLDGKRYLGGGYGSLVSVVSRVLGYLEMVLGYLVVGVVGVLEVVGVAGVIGVVGWFG